MPNLNRLMQILMITGVLLMFISMQKKTRGCRGSYDVIILISVIRILSDYDLFKRCTRFAPHIFIKYLYNEIEEELDEGVEYYGIPNIQQRRRRRKIPKIARVIRYCMRFAGWPTICLVLIFGQEEKTVNRDCKFIARIVCCKLYLKHVHLAIPGTREYNEWLGCGVFRHHFWTTIYALDICKFVIGKPGENQRDFYDGHNKDHNVGVGVMCNGNGGPCVVTKPFEGTVTDGVIWGYIKRQYELYRFVLPGNYIAGDRIFRYEEPPILTAYTGYDEYTGFMLLFNYFLAVIRIIIENLFSRFKVYFPIFMRWTFPLEWFDLYLHAGMVMLAIILKYQSPLRRD